MIFTIHNFYLILWPWTPVPSRLQFHCDLLFWYLNLKTTTPLYLIGYGEYEHHLLKFDTREIWLFQPQECSKSRLITCKSSVIFIISLKNSLKIPRLEKNSLFYNSPHGFHSVSYNYGLVCITKRHHIKVPKIQVPHLKKKKKRQEKWLWI